MSVWGPVLFNLYISDLDEERESTSSANLQMTENWEEWLIPSLLCCHSEGSQEAGEVGREKPLKA